MKASKKIAKRLDVRRRAWDDQRDEDKRGTKRPGSLSGAK